MAGYAIECALKATLMREWDVATLARLEERLRQEHDLSRSLFTHDLELLFGLTRLGRGAREAPNPTPAQIHLAGCFRACNQWTVSWRYSGSYGERTACVAMLSAADHLISQIRSSI